MSSDPSGAYVLSVGSLCTGYGGLDMGLALGLGTTLRHAWHVEYEAAPAAILRHRYPEVPNYGDLTTLDHGALEPARSARTESNPPWGTTRAGVLCARPTPALPTDGSGCSSLLKTPGGHGPTLADEVEHLLPTPRATDGTKGGPNQRGSSGDLMLPSAVLHYLPTPTARDWKGENQRRDTSCLPGVFTSPPSSGGSEPQDGLPFEPLSPEGEAAPSGSALGLWSG